MSHMINRSTLEPQSSIRKLPQEASDKPPITPSRGGGGQRKAANLAKGWELYVSRPGEKDQDFWSEKLDSDVEVVSMKEQVIG